MNELKIKNYGKCPFCGSPQTKKVNDTEYLCEYCGKVSVIDKQTKSLFIKKDIKAWLVKTKNKIQNGNSFLSKQSIYIFSGIFLLVFTSILISRNTSIRDVSRTTQNNEKASKYSPVPQYSPRPQYSPTPQYSPAPQYQSEGREVRIYSGRHYNTDKQIYAKFAQETGIKIRLIEATGISLVERLKREGSSSQADIILLVDAARIANAARSGLLQSYRSLKLDQSVPAKYRDPQSRWYALTRRVRVIVANPQKVNINSIKDYSDLSNPSLKGLVCLRKRSSPYNQSLVANQIVNKGEAKTKEWLKGMISNVYQPFFPGDIGLIRAVAQGKCGVAVVNHYYVSRMLAGVNGQKDKRLAGNVEVLTPNPAHVNVSAGGIAKYAKNKEEAIQLLEYLASPTGSRGLAGPTYEHPLFGFNTTSEVSRFGGFTPDNVTIDQLGENNKKAILLMRASGWQ